MVIVHAADVLVPVAEYIARRYPRKRVILWYWNNASPGSNPALARSQRRIELWSFDSEDCARYGMGHNTTYSFMSLSDIDATSDVDFFFFGADKGRAAILDELAGAITRAGLTHRLWIAGDESRGVSPSGVAFRSPMSYSAHLTNTARARVIVDVVQAGQSGMTLRPLEALFLGKKLLTNSLDIVHSPLYDPTRVFVFGLDDEAALRSFVETPMVRPTRALLEYYDVAGWIGRFENRMPH
ncbi:hypothetical protein [Microbacterium ulmi]|uniref:Uncharacterized protein n=1 Tax=Microbacterium ulmi TaxID=179095 RepID=A0A7Y2M0Q1_9MICO|nr:hypothetical protein [Microbacterium ulmi]NII70156.1 hypothetical protein [Microbacterium ulmi]NNH04304.1 hypothetical protein [Microbacterium ulmi]